MASNTFDPTKQVVQPINVKSILDGPILKISGLALLTMISAINLVDVRYQKLTIDLDYQVLCKLGLIGVSSLYVMYAFLTEARIRQILFSFPGFYFVLLIFFFSLACLTALSPTFAIASTGALAVVIVLTIAVAVQNGLNATLNGVFFGMSMFVLVSWVAWLFVPSVGVFAEPLADGEFSYRMAGLAHPNTLGQFSGLTIVLGSVSYFKYGQKSRIRLVIIAFAAGALVMSLSRTSIAATLAAMIMGFRHELNFRKYLRAYLTAFLLVLVLLIFAFWFLDFGYLVEKQMKGMTKSGEVSELTSATGRIEIWAESIGYIVDRPIIGYGAASSKELLVDFSSHTHNMILHVALATGIFGGAAFVMLLVHRVAMMFDRHSPVADAIVVFLLLNQVAKNQESA